jgi:asparagine synthase (glutamine-hydrolysing)
MPGIMGIIHKDPGVPESRAAIDAMVKSMRHEPFTTSGTLFVEALGLAAGWVSHQGSFSDCLPVWNETKEICLIFSGEDVSVDAEIPALRSGGHRIEAGDARALVHWYEEVGEAFLQKLNGCFSGVLVDLRSRRIFLFNDRFGLGRIYYYENDRAFYFASEAKALLRVLPELRQLDLDALAELLAYGCPQDQRTLFAKVRLLPGGSKWSFGPGPSTDRAAYFHREEWENLPGLDDKAYAEEFEEVFPRVLERYFQGPRTVGISLTGGIDTRMIMAWAPCLPFKRPCYTFSGIVRECADVKVAGKVARASQQRHEVLKISKDFFTEFPALVKRSILYADGTMDVSGAAELYMNKKAREIAPVRLTGNYGDQLIRGIVGFKPLSLRPEVFESQFGARLAEIGRTPLLGGENPLSFFCGKQLPWYHYPRYAIESSQLTVRSPFLDNDLVALAFKAPQACRDLGTSLRFIADGDRALARIPTDMGVVFSPAPLLGGARRLLQTFTKKAEYAYDYGMPPWLARLDRARSGLHLEKVFLGRHKYYHFRTWYRRELLNYVKSVLLDPRTLQRPYLNGPGLEKMVQAHAAGRDNFTQEIHWLLTSELIQRLLIEKG